MNTTDGVFQKIFQERQYDLRKRLENYLNKQGEKEIHDLRTSIRRLEAMYLIFPTSYKRKKTDNFVSAYKSLFRKNSILRDFDVIIKKLLNNGLTEEFDSIKYFIRQKEKKIKETLKGAKNLSKINIPYLKEGNSEKIIPKYERTIFLLIQTIQDLIPIVSSDESKIDELHFMRKTVKKLRYILEVEPNDSYQHLIIRMKLLQKLLGTIHDCDMAINFLKKYSKKFPELEPFILREEEIRSQTYKKLSYSLSV
jgi:CHAD domain-containing protein